ncbi:hypothetical protein ACOSP7_007148 [Xanthoceras sorbifolium]
MWWPGFLLFWPSFKPRLPDRLNTLRSLGPFKLNVDASVAVSAGVVGLGLAIRDDLGRMKDAGSVGITASLDPSLAEAMAVLHSIRLAIDSGFSHILVESDALDMINILRDGVIPSSDLGLIVLDIFQFCLCSSVISFSFVPRTTNKVANALAKGTVSFGSDCFWYNVCPPFVEILVQEDSPG